MDSNMRFTNIQPLNTSSWYLRTQTRVTDGQTYKDIYFDLRSYSLEYYGLSGSTGATILPKQTYNNTSIFRSSVPFNQRVTAVINITDAQGNSTTWSRTA